MKRTQKYVGFLCIAVVIALFVVSSKQIMTSADTDTDSYDLGIFYDRPDTLIFRDMTNYKTLILESAFYSKGEVEKLNKTTNTYGYMPVMQINHSDQAFYDLLKDEDYLLKDDNRLLTPSESSYYMDLSSVHYREHFLELLEKRIVNKSFQGVFLDTVDNLERFSDDDYQDLLLGYESLLKDITKKFPDLKIMQNRGFRSACDMSYEYIDILLWENFNVSDSVLSCDREWYEKQIKLLINLNVNVFAEVESKDATEKIENIKAYAKKFNFGFSETKSNSYMKWHFEDIRKVIIH